VLRDAQALLSSQLSVKRARVATWSAAPLSEKIRTGEHLLKESPVFCGSPYSTCGTLSRDALRRNRSASVMVISRKLEVERGAVVDARAQGNGYWESAMSAIPARASQLGFGGSCNSNRPRARSAMASVGSAPVASRDIDVDQRLDASMAEDKDGGGTIPCLYVARGQGKQVKSFRPSIDIKDTIWGSLSSFSGLGAGRANLLSAPLCVPEIEGEMTRPTTSQSDRKSACSSSLPSSPRPSLLDSEDRLQPFAALAADASASPGLKKMREILALDRLHEGALTAGVRPCSCIP
jgi:hypothetical protein